MTRDSRPGAASRLAGAIVNRLYPNSLFLLRRRAVSRQLINDEWQRQAERILQSLTPEDRARFDQLEPEVRERFRHGDLNPDLLQGALKHPDYFSETLDTSQPEVRSMIAAMSRALLSIKEDAARHGAEVLVISIPYKAYASRRDLESVRRLGLSITPEMSTTSAASEAINDGLREFGAARSRRDRSLPRAGRRGAALF